MPRKIVVQLEKGNAPILTESLADNEEQLQELIKEHPELIPIEEFGFEDTLLVVGRETSLPSGAVDLVGLTRSGEILVIEFKTGPQNSDFRRALAQLIDYGSDMWDMSFEEFESAVARRYFASDRCQDSRIKGKTSLQEAMKAVSDEFTEEDAELFREQVEGRLKSGAFEYVLVAQRFTPSIMQSMEYMNAAMSQSRFYAVELVKFDADKLSAFESRTVLKPTSKNGPPRSNEKLNEAETLNAIEDEEYKAAIEQIFEVCHGLGLSFDWGTSGVSLRVPTPGRRALTIAWWFRPGRSGWMGLTDLILGYDPYPAGKISGAIPIMKNYSNEINKISAVKITGHGGLDAYHFTPQLTMKRNNQIIEILANVVQDMQSINN